MATIDKELKVMSAIQRAIFSLNGPSRARVLAWVASKDAEGAWNDAPTPGSPPAAPAQAAAPTVNLSQAAAPN